jgi:hypothetical protein
VKPRNYSAQETLPKRSPAYTVSQLASFMFKELAMNLTVLSELI